MDNAKKRLKNLQRARVGLVASLAILDEEIKALELQAAPQPPRKRANLKQERINKYAQRYAIK